MKNITIYILTAVHNPGINLKKFIQSCLSQKYSNLKIIIVDDGSNDGSFKYIDSFSNIQLIRGSGKLWWGGSMNLGVQKILMDSKDIDYVLTVNDDCIFPENYVENMLNEASSRPHSVIGSFVIDINDKMTIIDGPTIMKWSKGSLISSYAGMPYNDLPKRKTFNTDTLTTRGTFYPVKVFKEVGNFDNKHFPHHIADIDLSLRAKKQGFSLIIPRDMVIYNDPERTGISLPENYIESPQKLSKSLNIIFSRRSSNNIFDHLNFISLHYPKEYQEKNIKRLLSAYFYIFTASTPFFQIKKNLRVFYMPLIKLIQNSGK